MKYIKEQSGQESKVYEKKQQSPKTGISLLKYRKPYNYLEVVQENTESKSSFYPVLSLSVVMLTKQQYDYEAMCKKNV